MNKSKILFLQRSIAFIDAILTISAFFIAFYLRNALFAKSYGTIKEVDIYLWMNLTITPICIVLFYAFKLYNVMEKEKFSTVVIKAALAIGISTVIFSAILFFMKEQSISRLLLGLYSLVDLLVILLFRLILRIVLHYYYQNKRSRTKVLVIGTNSMATRFTKYVNCNPQLMIDIIGYLQAGDIIHSRDLNILGKIEDLGNILMDHVIDEVIFALPRDYSGEVEPYIQECSKMGITVNMLADLFDFRGSNIGISKIGSLPVITFQMSPFNSWQIFLKRAMDILGALVGLAITFIAFLLVAPAIKLESRGPVFFGQDRVGRNGRIFRCYKFRSMYVGAEAQKKELMQYNQMNGAIFKMKDDPRVTKVGKFIRATSIDELPQFWNVLKGEMSLVGTRPPTKDEVEKYKTYHWKRLCIKPGITGMWQASGRNRIENFEEIVKLDTEYIDHWSIGLDIKLLFKTVQLVLARDGAY